MREKIINIIRTKNEREKSLNIVTKVKQTLGIDAPNAKMMDFLNYLEREKNHLCIVLSIKDTPGSRMPKDILIQLQSLGFNTLYTELWRMYIGVVDKGDAVIDYRANQKEDTIAQSYFMDGHTIEVKSSSWRRENIASILIDRIEYAINFRGINIVVYDYDKKEITNSIAYDSHDEQSRFVESNLLRQKKLKEWIEKNNHYDVAILSVFYGANYGSILNGWAIYSLLKKIGKKVLMLEPIGFPLENEELSEKNHALHFINARYDVDDISPLFAFTELDMLNAYAETFITASDQLWNWNVAFKGAMYQYFVDSSKRKISFATSCGSMNDNVPNNRKQFVKDCLADFDILSVRESASAELLRKKYGVFADVIQEPVFWPDVKAYKEIANESQIEIPQSEYALAYILDPNDDILKLIKKFEKVVPVITIPDGMYGIYKTAWDDNSVAQSYPGFRKSTEVFDFLKLYANASFVITDSFHGTCFSIIFEKKFLTICNHNRGKDRFYHMLSIFNLSKRLFEIEEIYNIDKRIIKKMYTSDIDYSGVRKIISTERDKAYKWIENALDVPVRNNHICKAKKRCMGCGACINSCPKEALSLTMGEYGYYQPKIDVFKCVDCGKCKSVCPSLNVDLKKNINNTSEPSLYECVLEDKKELKKCSSGGAFPMLAKKILEKKGVVYGVTWGDNFTAVYGRIDSVSRLHEIQKSKYLQAFTDHVLYEVKQDLEQGLEVLFSGVPCHVAGLYSYLGKEYKNLTTIDLLCGNSPSTEFFQQYISENSSKTITGYEFRTKDKRWHFQNPFTVTKYFDDGTKEIIHGNKEDLYQRAYHPHFMIPEHCEKCMYSKYPRIADITIGDFWWVDNKDITIDTRDGVSCIIINNTKGMELFDECKNENVFIKQVPLDWLGGNGSTTNNNWAGKGRDAFYEAILTKTFKEAVELAEEVK